MKRRLLAKFQKFQKIINLATYSHHDNPGQKNLINAQNRKTITLSILKTVVYEGR